MSISTLLTLADIHFDFGLIGIDEYIERCEIAYWLYDENNTGNDPREDGSAEIFRDNMTKKFDGDSALRTARNNVDSDEDSFLSFLFNGAWVFTKSDPDHYPSIPHGHYQSQLKKWPKLNPYNGRVFTAKHHEDTSKRLSKKEMSVLWNDEKFKDFCRSHLLWYKETFPHHDFNVAKNRLFRFPRW